MFKKTEEPHPANELKMNSVKTFSKVMLLQRIGLLSKRINYETLEFETSWKLTLVSNLSLVSKVLLAFKLFLSCLFPRASAIQLYIGRYSLSG